jgi:hypothetical protein
MRTYDAFLAGMHNRHTTSKSECILADTVDTRTQVYRLRYECYRRTGAIDAQSDELFSDLFDLKPNSFSFLVRGEEKEALATVRINVVRPDYGWIDSPVHHVYGDHPSFQAIAKESFVEASRLCFGCAARRDAFVRLVGHMAALADFYRVCWLVACPRVEHSRVYQRMFGFQPLAAPRRYFGVKFDTQLLGIRIADLREYVRGEKQMSDAWSDALVHLDASIRRQASTA